MNLFEKFVDLFKREVPETEVEALFQRLDVDKFFSGLNNLWHPSELIRKIGGLSKLENLNKDSEIYAAVDKRIAALLDTRLVLEGGSRVKFFEDNLKPFERQLKQDFWWAIPYGYGVEQIIYNPDRSGNVIGFQREEFYRFEPLQDLIHVRLVDTTNSEWRNKVMPYGKWVLTTNNGSYYNPSGDPMFERLIQPWIFRCNGWDLWMDFAKRFANGFMHAKIEDSDKQTAMRQALEKAGKSSVLVTDKSTDINMISASRDSSIYDMIDSKTISTMQKVILGETLSNQASQTGSYGAASIHNDVRIEKTMADIKLVEHSFNEVIKQIAEVNGFTDELPKATLVYDPGINADQAARDQVLTGTGIKFSKEYYMKTYGFKEEDFEITQPQSFGFSQKKKTFLKPQDIKEFMGASNECPDCSRTIKLAPNISRKDTRQSDEKEETVDFLVRSGTPPIQTDDLIAAISLSKTPKELEENLNLLFDSRSMEFVNLMTDTLYYSASKGALFGNPEKVEAKDE